MSNKYLFEHIGGVLEMDCAGPDEDPECHLIGQTTVFGIDMHVEMIQVTMRDGVQCAADSSADAALDDLTGLAQPDGPFQVLTAGNGRDYAITLYPFCE
jgi:hypothetical protein